MYLLHNKTIPKIFININFHVGFGLGMLQTYSYKLIIHFRNLNRLF